MGKSRKTPKPKAAKKSPGPEADRLVIEGDWEEAVRKAIRKPKPEGPTKEKSREN